MPGRTRSPAKAFPRSAAALFAACTMAGRRGNPATTPFSRVPLLLDGVVVKVCGVEMGEHPFPSRVPRQAGVLPHSIRPHHSSGTRRRAIRCRSRRGTVDRRLRSSAAALEIAEDRAKFLGEGRLDCVRAHGTEHHNRAGGSLPCAAPRPLRPSPLRSPRGLHRLEGARHRKTTEYVGVGFDHGKETGAGDREHGPGVGDEGAKVDIGQAQGRRDRV